MCLFINPIYIWLDDMKRRNDYTQFKENEKFLLNKTTKMSQSDESETISQSAEEVIEELNEYFENQSNTNTDNVE